MYMRSCILEPVREGLKPVEWKGDSLERARSFSKPVRQQVGYELELVQRGLEPSDWKPIPRLGRAFARFASTGTESTESSTSPGSGMQSTYLRPPQEDAEDIKARYRNGEGPVSDCASNGGD
jgi:hypothetical protein